MNIPTRVTCQTARTKGPNIAQLMDPVVKQITQQNNYIMNQGSTYTVPAATSQTEEIPTMTGDSNSLETNDKRSQIKLHSYYQDTVVPTKGSQKVSTTNVSPI